jgi:lipoprotein-anchoring transpeptidase ErfK/SrfK
VILSGIVILAKSYEHVKQLEIVAIEVQPLEEKPPEEIEEAEALRFDLKYDKYLVPKPYEYDIEGKPRVFQFEKMAGTFKKADEEFGKGEITYVDNYKNQNGYAPYYHGQTVDAAGTRQSASAPGYADLSDKNEFVYIPDGTLVRVIEEASDFTKVSLVEDGSEYFVPSKYVRTEHYLTDLNKAIAVDVSNQNIAVFEKRPEGWTVVSYSLATTGKVGKYHQPTPLGYFYAIEKRERFYYVKDGTNEIEGYAPYAVRFTAGAYIHGVAAAYQYSGDGTRIDPGIQEFSSTIGTVPLSHKCVRNYTSHAKFIYDWYVQGETIVVVID